MRTPRIPVAKEGYPFILYCAFVTFILALVGLLLPSLLALLLTTFVLFFFRDPERLPPAGKNLLLSPADGKVIIIEQVSDQLFCGQEAHKISIFMNVFNVHVNRIPFPGKVERIVHVPGKFYSADSTQGALQNEYCASIITTADGKRLAFVQMAGLIARRIVNWLEPGDMVQPGERFGLIRFGSRVDLYLPLETELDV